MEVSRLNRLSVRSFRALLSEIHRGAPRLQPGGAPPLPNQSKLLAKIRSDFKRVMTRSKSLVSMDE